MLAHNYNPLPITIVKADSCLIWDNKGKEYLDMFACYSSINLGHNNQTLLTAFINQAKTLTMCSRAVSNKPLLVLSEKLCRLTKQEVMLPMVTGAEAVETAMKAARKWGYEVKGIPIGKAEIITFTGNFHGRTIATTGLSDNQYYREGFGPYPVGSIIVPWGNLDKLRIAINNKTCAVIMEPIQGEAGIVCPPNGWLQGIRDLCTENNVLLFFDEIQTGLGRVGYSFAHKYYSIKADGLILGKALGGGLVPISAFLTSKEVMDVFTPGTHGSTFGGNPLACTVANKVLDILDSNSIFPIIYENAYYRGAQLKKALEPYFKVRGKGLFLGIEINNARVFCEKLLEHGILTIPARDNIVRLTPPLIITKLQIEQAVNTIIKVKGQDR